jgi:hypothetical protein
MQDTIPNGVKFDPRPIEAQLKDYLHPSGAFPIKWEEKSTIKRYTQRFQNGSFSCVFQSSAKALEVLTGKIISATPYFWRKNYPQQGAWIQDAGDIFYNRFSTLEKSSPSQNQSESEMNKIKQLTTNIGITGYRTIPNYTSIDQIAEAVGAFGQCLLTLGSNSSEYSKTPVFNGEIATFYHCICVVDFGLVNGVKTLFCEDSAGQNSSPDGSRNITEDFLKRRATGALYFLGAKDVSVPQDNQALINSLNAKIVELLKKVVELLKAKLAGR